MFTSNGFPGDFSGPDALLLRHKQALLGWQEKTQRPERCSNQHSGELKSLSSARYRDRPLTYGGFIPVCSMHLPATHNRDQWEDVTFTLVMQDPAGSHRLQPASPTESGLQPCGECQLHFFRCRHPHFACT